MDVIHNLKPKLAVKTHMLWESWAIQRRKYVRKTGQKGKEKGMCSVDALGAGEGTVPDYDIGGDVHSSSFKVPHVHVRSLSGAGLPSFTEAGPSSRAPRLNVPWPNSRRSSAGEKCSNSPLAIPQSQTIYTGDTLLAIQVTAVAADDGN